MNEQSLIMRVVRSSKTQLKQKMSDLNSTIIKKKETTFDSFFSIALVLGFKVIMAFLRRKLSLPAPKKG